MRFVMTLTTVVGSDRLAAGGLAAGVVQRGRCFSTYETSPGYNVMSFSHAIWTTPDRKV